MSKPRVVYQSMITRKDLRDNPEVLYIFGDNEMRVGLGGQAAQMRGEPNAVGVRTKRAPGNLAHDFWTDDTFDQNVAMIEEDLVRVLNHPGTVVVPSAGIGTGLSQLPQRAPRTFAYIVQAGLGGDWADN